MIHLGHPVTREALCGSAIGELDSVTGDRAIANCDPCRDAFIERLAEFIDAATHGEIEDRERVVGAARIVRSLRKTLKKGGYGR